MLHLAVVEQETDAAQAAMREGLAEHKEEPSDATRAYNKVCARRLLQWKAVRKIYRAERDLMLERALKDAKRLPKRRSAAVRRIAKGKVPSTPQPEGVSGLVRITDLVHSYHIEPMRPDVRGWIAKTLPEGSVIRQSRVCGPSFVVPASVFHGLLNALLEAFGKKSLDKNVAS